MPLGHTVEGLGKDRLRLIFTSWREGNKEVNTKQEDEKNWSCQRKSNLEVTRFSVVC